LGECNRSVQSLADHSVLSRIPAIRNQVFAHFFVTRGIALVGTNLMASRGDLCDAINA
jgi:hypothetical protein